MIIKLTSQAASQYAKYGIDGEKSYIVMAVCILNTADTIKPLYLIHASYRRLGGLPTSINEGEFDIVDGHLPSHWIIAKTTDKYGRGATWITYPEWANDPQYYEKMDDNESDKMRAVNKYGQELRQLVEEYKPKKIMDLYTEPF